MWQTLVESWHTSVIRWLRVNLRVRLLLPAPTVDWWCFHLESLFVFSCVCHRSKLWSWISGTSNFWPWFDRLAARVSCPIRLCGSVFSLQIPQLLTTDVHRYQHFFLKRTESSFRRWSSGRRYLLVSQRGVLSEQLREVRHSSTGSRVDPFLLYWIQLLQRGGGGGAQMCTHTHTHTHTKHTPYCPHPVVGSLW